jgi:hypothetical protein
MSFVMNKKCRTIAMYPSTVAFFSVVMRVVVSFMKSQQYESTARIYFVRVTRSIFLLLKCI